MILLGFRVIKYRFFLVGFLDGFQQDSPILDQTSPFGKATWTSRDMEDYAY